MKPLERMKFVPQVAPVIVLAALAFGPGLAGAVCLDPKTFISGYHVPLDEEVQSSAAIAIGKVVAERKLNDGPDGPGWIVATIYSVRVEKVLKGRLPKMIKLRTENDSGRYSMDVGETHILFLQPLEKGRANRRRTLERPGSRAPPAGRIRPFEGVLL